MAFETIKSFGPTNAFRFNCPIFGAEVEMKTCFQLRNEWAKGKHIPQRRGCQACLSASKCPLIVIMRDIQHDKKDSDIYHSTEPKVGRLKPEILERIARIVVPQSTLDRYQPIPEGQLARIESVQGLKGIDAMARNVGLKPAELEEIVEGTSPMLDDPRYVSRGLLGSDDAPKPRKPKATTVTPATGDLSDLVNTLAQKEAAE